MRMDPITAVLAVLAVYRVAYDLAYMDGPFALYTRLRGGAIQRFGSGHWVTTGVTCPVCLSFWAALPLAVLLALAWGAALWWAVVLWLGIAGGALALIKVTT